MIPSTGVTQLVKAMMLSMFKPAPQAPENELSPANAPISLERRDELGRIVASFGLPAFETLWPRLNRAFVHRSYRAESGLEEDNERLEFLGDSVIGLACTEHLVNLHPDWDEGTLSKLRATLVSRQMLGKIAQEMELGELLLLGAGEERSGGRERKSILGSALEAVAGAFYLEYSWRELRPALVRTIIVPALELNRKNQIVDYKSQLQEWAQSLYQRVPSYQVVYEGGPDHEKTFEVEVYLDEHWLGHGSGRRKKIAENEAARHALKLINGETPPPLPPEEP